MRNGASRPSRVEASDTAGSCDAHVTDVDRGFWMVASSARFPLESLTQGPEPFFPRVIDSGSRALLLSVVCRPTLFGLADPTTFPGNSWETPNARNGPEGSVTSLNTE